MIVAFFVLKTMTLSDLPGVLSRSAMTSAVVLLLVGAAMAFKTVVSLSYAPQILADYILSLSENPLVLLFLINILLFIVGMFLDAGPAIIILGPILGSDLRRLGRSPGPLRDHHVGEPDRRACNAAHGAGAVRRLLGVGRKSRNHRQGDPAIPRGRGVRDLPDHLRPGHFDDDPKTDRVRSMTKSNL